MGRRWPEERVEVSRGGRESARANETAAEPKGRGEAMAASASRPQGCGTYAGGSGAMAGQRVKCRTDPEGSNGRVSDGRRAAVAAQTVEAAVAGKHTRRGGAHRELVSGGGGIQPPQCPRGTHIPTHHSSRHTKKQNGPRHQVPRRYSNREFIVNRRPIRRTIGNKDGRLSPQKIRLSC